MTDVAAQLRALADQVDDLAPADLVGALVALTFTIWTGATTPTPSPPNGRGLTVDAVCARTSMSKRWVYQEARKGRLPFAHRLGRRLVFDEQGLERWLARRR